MELSNPRAQLPRNAVNRRKPSASPFLAARPRTKGPTVATPAPPPPSHDQILVDLNAEEVAILAKARASKPEVAMIGLVSGSGTKEKSFPQDPKREEGVVAQSRVPESPENHEKEAKQLSLVERKAIEAKSLRTPNDVIKMKILEHRQNPDYQGHLRELLKGDNTRFLSKEQVETLERSQSTVPRFLFRTYSLKDGVRRDHTYRCTNGSNQDDRFLPAADSNDGYTCQRSIAHLPIGAGLYMLGMHLRWMDQRSDEFLSWTNSLLFAIEHALGRMHKGEKDIHVAMVDIRKTRDVRAEQAAYYFALDLCEAFKVREWKGWQDKGLQELLLRKFTHEYLSHGTVFAHNQGVRRVSLQHLIEHGLFELYPEFEVPTGFETTRLYTRLVALRKAWFPAIDQNPWLRDYASVYSYDWATKTEPITERTMQICNQLAAGFAVQNVGPAPSDTLAPLHALLTILSMRKRRLGEHVLIDWTQDHYTAAELEDGYHDKFTHVPVNLPERIQYVDLVRHAYVALGVKMIPITVLQIQNPTSGEHYERNDALLQKNAELYIRLSHKEIKLWIKRARKIGKANLIFALDARLAARKCERKEELRDLKELRAAARKRQQERWGAFKPISTKRPKAVTVVPQTADTDVLELEMEDVEAVNAEDGDSEATEEMDVLSEDAGSANEDDLPLFVQDDE